MANPRPSWWRRWFGDRSERAAARFLKRLRYRILARNYHAPQGEIDLIALDGDCLVFVEVRSRDDDDVQEAAASVDDAKQRRVTAVAVHYLKTHRLLGRSARFDVLALAWPDGRAEPIVAHYRDAFPPVGRFQVFT